MAHDPALDAVLLRGATRREARAAASAGAPGPAAIDAVIIRNVPQGLRLCTDDARGRTVYRVIRDREAVAEAVSLFGARAGPGRRAAGLVGGLAARLLAPPACRGNCRSQRWAVGFYDFDAFAYTDLRADVCRGRGYVSVCARTPRSGEAYAVAEPARLLRFLDALPQPQEARDPAPDTAPCPTCPATP
jgi:hypothetical protein